MAKLDQSDLDAIKDIVDVTIEEKLDEKFELKFEEKMQSVRDDFHNTIDPLIKEIKDSREERTILSHRVADHSDRIEKLEGVVLKN